MTLLAVMMAVVPLAKPLVVVKVGDTVALLYL